MLAHIRDHLAALLAPAGSATLASDGPAGLQAQIVPCAAAGLRLRLLLPRTSDQLLNLEAGPPVVVTSERWQLWGRARLLAEDERPGPLGPLAASDARWYAIVEVRPTRIAVAHATGWGAAETFDVEPGEA